MTGVRFVFYEAKEEFLHGVRSGVVQLLFLGLTAYLLLVLSNAGYIREMGAVGIPRNAPMMIYLMMAGQAFYLIFAYAWLFAQTIVRDRQAGLHELVLATPRPLYQLLLGRYLGAFGVACVLGLSQAAGFLFSPVLAWLGLVPAGEIMSMPWLALLWGWLLFVIPLAAGMGAYYITIAVITKKSSSCFAFAAVLVMCWMFSMVILKGGHINAALATMIDPSGYAEAETQVLSWTPAQKTHGFIALTGPFLLNRLFWGLLPLLLLPFVLWRTRRESLALIQSKPSKASKTKAPPLPVGQTLPGPVSQVSWWKVTFAEWRWLCRQLLSLRAFWVSLLLMTFMGVAGSFVHVVSHADGPLVPRPGLLGPTMQEFVYLVIVFVIAGLIGHIARKDDKQGFGEIFDTTPAPTWVRGLARFGTIITLLFFFSIVPSIAGLITTLLTAPETLSISTYLLMSLAQMFPAFLELGACIFLAHAIFRSSGVAHATSMLIAFIMVLNHELSLVTFPLLEMGIPVHARYSVLTGWLPWWDVLLVGGLFKMALSFSIFAIAGMCWPHGTEHTSQTRRKHLITQLQGSYGRVFVVSGLLALLCGGIGYHHYVNKGDYESNTAKLASDASWEKRWLRKGGQYSLQGGEVELSIIPSTYTIKGKWRLRGVKSSHGRLHAALPSHITSLRTKCAGKAIPHDIAHDFLSIDLRHCETTRHALDVEWSITQAGWLTEGHPQFLTKQGFWIRAIDVMPRLGMSTTRILRSPAERQQHGLPSDLYFPQRGMSPSVLGVAPAGRWTWRVTHVREGANNTVSTGQTRGPLDFGVAWSPKAIEEKRGGYHITVAPSYRNALTALLEDIKDMRGCVSRTLGSNILIQKLQQVPRGLGTLAQIGQTLWLPEGHTWDIAATKHSPGRSIRRAALAQAMARTYIARSTKLRESSGYLWMTSGAAGAIAMLCVGKHDGAKALHTLLKRGSVRTIEALSGSPVPVTTLAQARASDWAHVYAPLAALYWSSQQTPQTWQQIFRSLRQGMPLTKVLRAHAKGLSVASMLGPPNASDVKLVSSKSSAKTQATLQGTRWQWKQGGWQKLLTYKSSAQTTWNPTLTSSPPSAARPVLVLDKWCSFERDPGDNNNLSALARQKKPSP